MRHDENQPRAGDFTPQERIELRELLVQRRNFSGFAQVITTFAKWFIAFSAAAILFKQSVLDFVASVRGMIIK